jgi:hypothetical protein
MRSVETLRGRRPTPFQATAPADKSTVPGAVPCHTERSVARSTSGNCLSPGSVPSGQAERECQAWIARGNSVGQPNGASMAIFVIDWSVINSSSAASVSSFRPPAALHPDRPAIQFGMPQFAPVETLSRFPGLLKVERTENLERYHRRYKQTLIDRRPPERRGLAKWRDPDSNRGHHDFQSCALPAELSRRAGRC